jgi:hypothetical protein
LDLCALLLTFPFADAIHLNSLCERADYLGYLTVA